MKGSDRHIYVLAVTLLATTQLFAQHEPPQGIFTPDPNFNEKRFYTVVISEIAVSSLVTVGLNYLWYKKFPHSRFHFFNDNREWLNMDKLGHAATAYNISSMQYDLMRWSGVSNSRASWIGGLTGVAFLAIVEVFDGLSSKWGFSKGDMLANIAGSGLFMLQQELWKEQRVQLRFSYHNSIYAKHNPEELGYRLPQRLLKDYNGQTYWLSFNIASFCSQKSDFPRWLVADIGYGAEGMTGATKNPSLINGQPIPSFPRYRKLYFGIDGAFKVPGRDAIPFPGWINMIRIPAPVVEWDLNGTPVKFRKLYY